MAEYLALLSLYDGGWGKVLLAGAFVTISLALCCLPFGLCLGLLSALLIRSKIVVLRTSATIIAAIFRGLPELLTLFIVYNGLQLVLQSCAQLVGYGGSIGINAFFAGVLGLGLVFAAFSSEVWLSAFNTVAIGQYEAADALGLTRLKTFFAIILPQTFRNALPGLSNNWLTLLKDTSLVSTISLVDIMRQTSLAASATRHPMFFYSIAMILYLIFSAITGFILKKIEQRYAMTFKRVAL